MDKEKNRENSNGNKSNRSNDLSSQTNIRSDHQRNNSARTLSKKDFIYRSHIDPFNISRGRSYDKRKTSLLAYGGSALIFTHFFIKRGLAQPVDLQSSQHFLLLIFLWDLHFVRRCIEAIWVHKFSNLTEKIPLFEVIGVIFYYYFFAFWIGASANAGNRSIITVPSVLVTVFSVTFVISEIGNLICHIQLRNNNRLFGWPRGFLFEYVVCPHYFFELTTWVSFALLTMLLSAMAFAFVSFCVLYKFARERLQKYRFKYNGDNDIESFPRHIKAFIPLVL